MHCVCVCYFDINYKRLLKENDFPIQCSLGVGHKHTTTAVKIHSEILRDGGRESGGVLS